MCKKLSMRLPCIIIFKSYFLYNLLNQISLDPFRSNILLLSLITYIDASYFKFLFLEVTRTVLLNTDFSLSFLKVVKKRCIRQKS